MSVDWTTRFHLMHEIELRFIVSGSALNATWNVLSMYEM